MHDKSNTSKYRIARPVWDRTTRWFHWVNVLCVLALAALGLAILNEKSFGVSAEGKVLLKTLHVYVGYVLAANLAWRIIWAFIGGQHARWKSLLPLGQGYTSELRLYVRGFVNGNAPTYLGHNPLGRLMVSLLFLLLFTQAATGLILAGTDLYKPPFGGVIAEWVTDGDAEKLSQLKPGSKDYVDPAAYDDMRAFRKPIVTTHLYAFYVLMGSILLHIVGVVVTEVREKNGLTSAMFSGEKVLSGPPVDAPSTPSENRSES
ncbi:MAG: cytochrome b/b6 domain-containing protein [Pseudomonadales bacterium]